MVITCIFLYQKIKNIACIWWCS